MKPFRLINFETMFYKLINKLNHAISCPDSLVNSIGKFRLKDKTYFNFINYLKILPIKNRYSNSHSNDSQSCKTVFIMFDGTVYNTGLADKLRAITSVYYWTKKNGYDFRILFNYPFDLQDHLIPSRYNWVVNRNSIVYCEKYAVPKALISFNGIFGEKKNIELHKYYLDSFLKEGEKQIHLYTNTYCYEEYFRECFHELFKPSLELKKELDYFSKEIGDNYISISF